MRGLADSDRPPPAAARASPCRIRPSPGTAAPNRIRARCGWSRRTGRPVMPRVLLFATTTGYQTRMFGEAADRLGVELVFATDRCDQLDDPWQDSAIPIRFHDDDASLAKILAAARDQPLDGMLVVGDRPGVIAALAAEA